MQHISFEKELNRMPAGDAQRVWFPEMLDDLKSSWSMGMDWSELADFCERMTEKRKHIRKERDIRPPREIDPLSPGERCPKCGRISKGPSKIDPLAVSIRSALFALKNNGVITEVKFKELDKSWMKHKRKNGLDAYGRKAEESNCEGNSRADSHFH